MLNDQLANDRTFLAWLRTGIACFGLGFVVAKWALIINTNGGSVDNKAWYSLTGAAIVLSGAALVAAGYWQHRTVSQALQSDAATAAPRWPIAMTAVAVVGAVALSLLILLST
jgi:putative membrane protein